MRKSLLFILNLISSKTVFPVSLIQFQSIYLSQLSIKQASINEMKRESLQFLRTCKQVFCNIQNIYLQKQGNNIQIRNPIKMFFTIPVLIAIVIVILAILLILQPQNLSTGAVQNKMMRYQFRSTRHKWQKCQMKSFYFCYLCHKLTNGWFSDVLQCKKCGIIIHRICKYLKLRKPECKYIVSKSQNSKFYHQWRQCSFNCSSDCTVCNTICTGLQSYICIWCRRTRHGFCDAQNIECDFGQMKNFILQPTQIKCKKIDFTVNAFQSLRKNYKRIKQRTSQSQSQPEKQDAITFKVKPYKRPVIVIINKKSGGQTGNDFIKAFYQLLNPLQVISILDQGLQKLKLFVKVPNIFFIIAGGDGTICSVLNYIKRIPQWSTVNPPAAILPLGTGNDLSRSLGWGGTAQQTNPADLVKEYNDLGKTEFLDRWRMTIKSDDTSQQQFTIYNYAGVGLDAKICKDFHQMRQKHPQLFFSQFSNKLIYTQMGLVDVLSGNKISLSQILKIKVDGQEISIDQFQNVVFLNIYHWGGGVTGLWKQTFQNKRFAKQSFSDGKIQMIGLTDAIHMGQVQVGMDDAFQLAQCQVIQIIAQKPNQVVPLQIDGQPMQLISPFKIRIERKDQVQVLATTGTLNGKISKLLNEGLKQQIITQEQLVKLSQLASRFVER